MTRLLSLSLVALAACGSPRAKEPARYRAQGFANQARGFGRPAAQRGAAIHEPFTPPITAAKIRTAIDDAVYYLRTQQGADGSVHGDDGSTSLTALTLLAAGADPA